MTLALETRDLTKTWGAFVANEAISLSLPVGARHALIGPNGAGKTTLVNMLAGVLPPTRGDVFLGPQARDHVEHPTVRQLVELLHEPVALPEQEGLAAHPPEVAVRLAQGIERGSRRIGGRLGPLFRRLREGPAAPDFRIVPRLHHGPDAIVVGHLRSLFRRIQPIAGPRNDFNRGRHV